MKRVAIVLVMIILAAGSLPAQDARQLADDVKKMQQQVATLLSQNVALESRVSDLQAKLNAVAGFTATGGNYVLNAGAGSVTIKAGALLFESSGALNLKAGSTASIESGGTLTLLGLAAVLRGNSNLALDAPKIVIESSGQIDLKASGSLNLKGVNRPPNE